MVKGKSGKQVKQRSHPVTYRQFLAIILITLALAVALDFGHRAAVSADLHREAQHLEREVTTLEAENRALKALRERVQTDDFVEEWARTEGAMVLYGETPVIPVPADQAGPAGRATPGPSSESGQDVSRSSKGAVSHWQEWWALFFGSQDGPTQPDQGW